MRRPALVVSICYISGLLLGHYSSLSPGFYFRSVALLALVTLLQKRNFSKYDCVASFCLCGMLSASGAFWYVVQTRTVPGHHIARYSGQNEPALIKGHIVKEPDIRSAYALVTVSADSIIPANRQSALPAVGLLLVRLDGDLAPGKSGDLIAVTARLRSPSPARNRGGFDAWSYYSGQGIYVLTSIRKPANYTILKSTNASSFHGSVIRPLKLHIESTIDRTLTGTHAALMKGILLGQRRQLPDDLLAAFTSIGLTHILAVSGLHVGIITLICMTLFALLRLPRPATVSVTILLLVMYAFITNLTPSVIRASLMAGLLLVGDLLDRQSDSVNILCVAAVLILVIWPQAIFALGFQLSFVATFAIVVGYEKLKSILPTSIQMSSAWWVRWIRDGFAVSIAAQIGTMPIIAYSFFQTALMASLANLVIGPLVFLATTLGVLSVFADPVSAGLASLFGAANWVSLEGMITASTFFASFPGALILVSRPSMAGMVIYYSILLLLVFPVKMRHRYLAGGIVLSAIALIALIRSSKTDDLVITMIDVGQGDSILLRYPDGYTMLIDGGPASPSFDAGSRTIVPYLRASGIRHIDSVVVSHPHTDHYGGLPAIVGAVSIGEIINGGVEPESRYYQYWRRVAAEHGVPVRAVSSGDTLFDHDPVKVFFLHPDPAFAHNPPSHGANNASVVMKLVYRDFSLLLTGDAEEEAERAIMIRDGNIRSTILKAGHHGSRTSSTPAFMEAVNPEAVIISVGVRNKFRHPAPEVVGRYREYGADVFRTDRHGAITIRTDGFDFEITPMISFNPRERWLTPAAALASIFLTHFPTHSIFGSDRLTLN
jgi:competence protein ComEC